MFLVQLIHLGVGFAYDSFLRVPNQNMNLSWWVENNRRYVMKEQEILSFLNGNCFILTFSFFFFFALPVIFVEFNAQLISARVSWLFPLNQFCSTELNEGGQCGIAWQGMAGTIIAIRHVNLELCTMTKVLYIFRQKVGHRSRNTLTPRVNFIDMENSVHLVIITCSSNVTGETWMSTCACSVWCRELARLVS